MTQRYKCKKSRLVQYLHCDRSQTNRKQNNLSTNVTEWSGSIKAWLPGLRACFAPSSTVSTHAARRVGIMRSTSRRRGSAGVMADAQLRQGSSAPWDTAGERERSALGTRALKLNGCSSKQVDGFVQWWRGCDGPAGNGHTSLRAVG